MIQAFERIHPIMQLTCLVAIGLLAMGVLMSITTMIFYALGVDLHALSLFGDLSTANSQQILMLKLVQIAQAVGLFVTPYLVFKYVLGGATYDIKLERKSMAFGAVFFMGILVAFPFITFLVEWNAGLNFPIDSINQWMHDTEAQAEKLIRVFLTMEHAGHLVFNLFLIALLPAVGEEMLFRGTAQPLLIKTFRGNYHLAVWVTAFVFSFIHLQFLGFVPRFILGAMLGYAAHWSGSLWAPMLGHFANNALAVVLVYLIGPEFLDADAEVLGVGLSWMYAIPSALLLAACMAYLFKNKIQQTPRLI